MEYMIIYSDKEKSINMPVLTDQCDTRIIHHDKVARAKHAAVQEDELLDLSSFFKIFADPNRLRTIASQADVPR